MATLITPKCRFLHIPKTGGKWIVYALKVGEVPFIQYKFNSTARGVSIINHKPRKHADCLDSIGHNQFTFTFIRNPLNWYQSWWSHQYYHKRSFVPGVKILANFNLFLKKFLLEYPSHFTKLINKYVICADFIGKNENISYDLCTVLDLANEQYNKEKILKIKNERIPKRSKNIQKQKYTEEVFNLVIQSEKQIFHRFDYPLELSPSPF